jgi:hypothetical protein
LQLARFDYQPVHFFFSSGAGNCMPVSAAATPARARA